MAELDQIDFKIMRLLQQDGRLSNVQLAEKVSLSPSACSRRVQHLEESGVIKGYHAFIDDRVLGLGMAVYVQITLKSQSQEALTAFEEAAKACPNVLSCDLMSGSSDYSMRIGARDLQDYERIHREILSRFPGVARIESNFALRRVVDRWASVA